MDLRSEVQLSFNHLTDSMTLFGHAPIHCNCNRRVNLGLKWKVLRSTFKIQSLELVSETKIGPDEDLDRELTDG